MVAKLRDLMRREHLAVSVVESKQSGLIDKVLETLGSGDSLELEMGEMANQILRMIDEINLTRADLAMAKDTLGHSATWPRRTTSPGTSSRGTRSATNENSPW